ncbi:MAG TPA: hypothetical protein VFC15_16040 [Candidatus Limnocylindrales bacterium]|nr:hypothetical protein [Candidatus Limnocylindrales bacterium]
MTRFPVRTGLLVLALMLSLSAFAKPKTDTITLFDETTVSGTNLAAGQYTVKYDVNGSTAQVKFLKGNKEVATANGQVKNLTKKADSTQVVLNTEGNARSIAEIDFGGKDTAISFESSRTTAGK